MSVDRKFELWLYQSIVRFLRDAAPMAGVTIQYPGLQKLETTSLEEWCALHLLSMGRRPSREPDWVGVPLLQVSCFSKFAERRADKSTDAPWRLAGKVRKSLEHQPLSVVTIGDPSEVQVACATFHDADMTYAADEDEENHQVVVTLNISLGTR